MKINKISLYNFNSYEGHNEFDFESRDKSKNIVLIGGKNGAGKTSLFTAIKIALYGPLAFGYVGPNAHYIAKIKDCINSKAFQKNEVNAEVRLTLSLMVEREYKEYVITRNWKYINQKLEETYTVLEEGKQLANQELSYFQNYLQGLIPPDLFEFFLFDGEEVGNIFSSNSYNTYIKNAIYTLCGIDIFEIIRKFTSGYSSRANGEADDELYDQYEQLKGLAEKLEDKLSQIKEQLDEEQIKYEQIEVDLFDLETAYKNAGGITQEERDELASEYESAEKIKSETSLKIKMFVEGLMPFFIVGEFADQISKQLSMQERRDAYKWGNILYSNEGKVNIIQLTLFSREMQVIITEMMLWDAWYYTKKYGTKDKPFVVVLDEAQNLSHTMKSPSAAILTEGRKFGWSAWFATQSLKVLKDDEVVRLLQASFKLYFKPTDDEMVKISKQIDATGEGNWLGVIQGLQKGQCIVVGDRMLSNGKVGAVSPVVTRITSFQNRI